MTATIEATTTTARHTNAQKFTAKSEMQVALLHIASDEHETLLQEALTMVDAMKNRSIQELATRIENATRELGIYRQWRVSCSTFTQKIEITRMREKTMKRGWGMDIDFHPYALISA